LQKCGRSKARSFTVFYSFFDGNKTHLALETNSAKLY